MGDKSSKEEVKRFNILKLQEIAGEIKGLEQHPVLKAVINGIEVFTYTPDSAYFDCQSFDWVFEEYKGYLRERHDSLLRMKILSALNPCEMFRLYEGPGKSAKLTRVYKAGKAIRQMKAKNK